MRGPGDLNGRPGWPSLGKKSGYHYMPVNPMALVDLMNWDKPKVKSTAKTGIYLTAEEGHKLKRFIGKVEERNKTIKKLTMRALS